jgi:hypothetical protein
MKCKICLGLFFGLLTIAAYAEEPPAPCETNGAGHAYLKFGSGASISTKSHISAPVAVWDPANQGYDSKLGTRPIVDGGFGYEFCPYAASDIMLAYRPNFKYTKFQTSENTFNTPGFLPEKTRRFNLDLLSLMGTIYLQGRDVRYLNWRLPSCFGEIYPIIGGGVGVTQVKIYNFRATGLPPNDPAQSSLLSFSAENQYTIRYRFTYQLMGGLEYRFKNRWALAAGYRWFDLRRFKGPRYFRDREGDSFDAGRNNEWKIDFSANEAFVELKLFL